MTEYELNGPWTGNTLQATPHHSAAHLPLRARLFILLAVLAVIFGALVAINH